jgi:hypothetical protein
MTGSRDANLWELAPVAFVALLGVLVVDVGAIIAAGFAGERLSWVAVVAFSAAPLAMLAGVAAAIARLRWRPLLVGAVLALGLLVAGDPALFGLVAPTSVAA